MPDSSGIAPTATPRSRRKRAGSRDGGSAATAVRAGDDLEEMTTGILPVHAAAAVIRVDLAGPAPSRVGPVRQATRSNAAEDLVEPALIHQECVVLRMDRAVVVGEIQRDVIVHLNDEERPVGCRLAHAEEFGQERRRLT